ncbi:MAG: 50S ribosomal protein L25/general stress protein Ctc [Robiginitomaculum sp.]|nr:MAG: 50S ribosomal protein L25/general stress protein Ctc [Robiginitomaculum sp.]
MADICLKVEIRENTGTGNARAGRRDGRVPGILYGGDLDNVAISLSANDVHNAIMSGGFINNTITIDHKGDKQLVITRDIQFHPVNDRALHVDLYRVDKDQIIEVDVSVLFINHEEAPGLKKGGALNVVRHDIALMSPAGKIPSSIEIDLTGFDIGDSVHISEVKLPDGVTSAITDRDFTIATITGSRAAVVEAEEAVEAAAAEAAAAEAAETAGEDGDTPKED